MNATTEISASPKKLNSGAWGAWANDEDVTIGDTLRITTRGGKSWTAKVSRVIWAGRGGAICETVSSSSSRSSNSSRPSKYTRRGRAYYQDGVEVACGYPCPVTGRTCTPDHPCHDCM